MRVSDSRLLSSRAKAQMRAKALAGLGTGEILDGCPCSLSLTVSCYVIQRILLLLLLVKGFEELQTFSSFHSRPVLFCTLLYAVSNKAPDL